MILVALLVAALAAPAQESIGRLHGVVADESGGVLPGVTVVASTRDGRVLANGVTDAVGRYALRALPASAVRLTFQLEGFADAIVDVTLTPDADATVATQRLTLAQKSETVNVHAGVRPDPLPSPPRVAPPAAPRPVLRPVPEHDKDSICGPSKPGPARSLGTIRSGRAASGNALYTAGDEVVIEIGKDSGLEVGQHMVARRAYRTGAEPDDVAGEHTAGLLQIVAADGHTAKAMVIYACDELVRGDWLAPFVPEPVRAPERAGVPAYDRAARILLTDSDQMIGAPRRLMVIDQGTDHGIRVGQRLTLFRPATGRARRPSIVGDAVVVALRSDSATIRVEHAYDVIARGDSAAPQRP